MKERFDHFRQPFSAQPVHGQIEQPVDQSEEGFPGFLLQPSQQGLQIQERVLRRAALEEGLRYDLQGIGDSGGVFGGDLVVRVQADVGIVVPQLHRFVEDGRRGRRHGPLGGGGGDLLAVARPAVGQDLAHDPSAAAAHVPLMVGQQLVEEGQRPPLVGSGHIGAELLEDLQIRPDAVQVLFAAGPIQQLPEAHVPGHIVHEADVVLQRELSQGVQTLPVGEQGGVRPRQGLGRFRRDLGAHAAVDEQPLEVLQLIVDRSISALLLRRHVIELGEDHVVALGEIVDAHDLPPVLPRPPHTKIRIDQDQGFQAQVFEFQIPGGVVGGDVGDPGQALLREPPVRIVIMQVGDPLGVLAPTAEFADVMGQRGGADQGDVHGHACHLSLADHVQRQGMDSDGMGGGIEGHGLPAQSHERHEAGGCDRPAEPLILVADKAIRQLRLGQRGDVAQGIVGAAAGLRLQKEVQDGEIELHGLSLRLADGAPLRIGEKAVGQLLVAA